MWPASLLTVEIRREFKRLLGMEISALRLLETIIDTLPPDVKPAVIAHYEETRWQVDLLQTCTELLDADALPAPSLPGRDAAVWGSGLDALRAQNAFEISNYQSALVVARRVPIPEISEICEELLMQERSFSRWLGMHAFDAALPDADKTPSVWTDEPSSPHLAPV